MAKNTKVSRSPKAKKRRRVARGFEFRVGQPVLKDGKPWVPPKPAPPPLPPPLLNAERDLAEENAYFKGYDAGVRAARQERCKSDQEWIGVLLVVAVALFAGTAGFAWGHYA